MNKTSFIGVVGLAAILAGCGIAKGKEEDAGPATERDFQVGNFNQIELAGGYDVNVRTGSAPSVHAKGGQNVLDKLEVKVVNGVLEIGSKNRSGFNWAGNNGRVTLDVTVPSLAGVALAGSGDIKVDRVTGDKFEAGISGSGNLNLDQVEVGTLKLAIAGSGGAKAGSGKVTSAEYDIAGSGDIDARGVASETTNVSIAGSGGIAGQATKAANVNIMGSGDVELTGGGKCNVSKHGSGDVRCS
jgi:hypothetical protein